MRNERLSEIARANAEHAVDQVGAYDSPAEAFHAYEQNAYDSALEEGASHNEASLARRRFGEYAVALGLSDPDAVERNPAEEGAAAARRDVREAREERVACALCGKPGHRDTERAAPADDDSEYAFDPDYLWYSERLSENGPYKFVHAACAEEARDEGVAESVATTTSTLKALDHFSEPVAPCGGLSPEMHVAHNLECCGTFDERTNELLDAVLSFYRAGADRQLARKYREDHRTGRNMLAELEELTTSLEALGFVAPSDEELS